MRKTILKYLAGFFILVVLQVFVLNKIQISGYINPFLYVFFILILPFDIPKYLLLILAFILGVTIDMFCDTAGLHTSATLFMAFLRPGVIHVISVKKEFEPKTFPGLHNMNSSWVITYSIILIFLHHTFLFFLEAFSFTQFFATLWRSIVSSLVTFALVFTGFFLVSKPYRR